MGMMISLPFTAAIVAGERGAGLPGGGGSY